MKLAARFALLAGLLGAAGLPAVALFVWAEERGPILTLLEKDQMALAAGVLSALDRKLHDGMQDIQIIAAASLLSSPGGGPGDARATEAAAAEARRLDARALLTGPWDDLAVAGPAGLVLAATDRSRTGTTLTDPVERAAFEAAWRGVVFTSELVLPAGAVRPTMIFAAPVREGPEPYDRVTAVVLGRLGWPSILEILDEVHPSVEPVLLDGATRVIATRSEGRNRLLRETRPIREPGIRAGEGPEKGPFLVTVARQKGYLGFRSKGWVLVLETPLEAFSARMTAATLRPALRSGVLFLVTLGLLTAVVRRSIRPLEAVSDAARRLGAGDLSVRTGLSRRDEIGELGQAFDRMAEKLQGSMEEIRRQSALVESIVENLAEGVIVADSRGRYLFFNRAARALMGSEAPSGEMPDGSVEVSRLRRPDGVTPFPEDELPLARAIRGEPSQDVEIVVAVTGGRPDRVVAVSGRPLRTRLGTGDLVAAGGVVVFRDVSAERETQRILLGAKEDAEEAARLKSQFLASMSHEIRTPLNGVIGLTEVLLGSGLNPQQRDYVETVRTSGEALLSIVNDILDLSRLESGQMTLEDVLFDLPLLVEEATGMVAVAARKKYLDLAVRLAPGVPRVVRGDPGRLQQVLLNLLSNAVKFTFEGWVLLDVSCLERTAGSCLVELRVEDTGVGIDEEEVPRLFAPFTQADAGTARRFGGTGLGLAIAKQLVSLLGGTIGAAPRPGGGSVFRFTVPLALAAEAGQPGQPEQPEPEPIPASLGPLRVLVVDDHEVNRFVLAERLATWGLRNEAACSGEEALALVRAALVECGVRLGLLGYRSDNPTTQA